MLSTYHVPEIDEKFLRSPKCVKSFISAASSSYGVYSIGACLCMKKGVPLTRSFFVAVPLFFSVLGYGITRPD